MTPDRQAAKLDLISKLTPRELNGWRDQLASHDSRPPFPGERAALLDRAKLLGMKGD